MNTTWCSGGAMVLFSSNQDNVKLDTEPQFTKLTYSDSGFYECEVTVGALSRKASFELGVEGRTWVKTLHKIHSSILFKSFRFHLTILTINPLLFVGPPVIKQLITKRAENGQHEVLICVAEGSPKPAVSWSINGTVVCTHEKLQS